MSYWSCSQTLSYPQCLELIKRNKTSLMFLQTHRVSFAGFSLHFWHGLLGFLLFVVDVQWSTWLSVVFSCSYSIETDYNFYREPSLAFMLIWDYHTSSEILIMLTKHSVNISLLCNTRHPFWRDCVTNWNGYNWKSNFVQRKEVKEILR